MAHFLKLSNELTIQNAEEIRLKLSTAVADNAIVRVDCSEATEVDLSFIQLLIAARKTASAAGREFGLAAPADGPLLDALKRGGVVADGPGSASFPADDFWSARRGE
jgi:ABC-type transporter Mla MlaB component